MRASNLQVMYDEERTEGPRVDQGPRHDIRRMVKRYSANRHIGHLSYLRCGRRLNSVRTHGEDDVLDYLSNQTVLSFHRDFRAGWKRQQELGTETDKREAEVCQDAYLSLTLLVS